MSDPRPIRLLSVSPHQAGRHALSAMLQQAGFEVHEAATAAEALHLALDKPDLILIDFAPSDQSGLEFCYRIKASPATASIPILPLFLGPAESGSQAQGTAVAGGGSLAAAVQPGALIAAIETLLRVRVTEKKFQGFVEAAPDAVVIAAPDGRIDQVNAQTERLFGYGRDELIGRPVEMLMPERYRRRHAAHRTAYVARPGTRPMGTGLDLYGVRKNGEEFPVEISLSPLPTEEGVLVASIIRDISAHQQLEAELRRGKAELEQAHRQKDEFLAMLAHELRNPLAPIPNAVQVLQDFSPADVDLQWARDVIGRQVQHMTRLVDDLLDVSRINRGKITLHKERLKLAQVMADAVEIARPHIEGRRHKLTVSHPAEPLWLEADPTRLAQVVANLLNNAAKYTEKGGRIWLTTDKEGEEAVVRVRDTGMGIAPDKQPQVFELFTQLNRSLDRSEGGLGVGLTLARRLVELHGGGIQVFSDGPGQGSEFVVRLPLLLPEAGPGNDMGKKADLPSAPASSRRILIADDNEDFAESCARLLRRMGGHEVKVVYDGLAALEAAQTFRPQAAFLDIGLPGLDGYQLARRLRQLPGLEGLLLVALTGYGQEEDRRHALMVGFDEHLTKPVQFDTLQRLLAERAGVARV